MIARGLGLDLPAAWGEPHSGAVSHQQLYCFFVCTFGPRGKLCNVLSLLNRIKEILCPWDSLLQHKHSYVRNNAGVLHDNIRDYQKTK